MCITLLAAGALWVLLRLVVPAEPSYQGKLLSAWVFAPPDSGDGTGENVSKALRAMGPRTLPVVLGWLEAEDSSLKTAIRSLVQRQGLYQPRLIVAEERHLAAKGVLEILGPAASPAVPKLEAMALFHVKPGVRCRAIEALAVMSTNAASAHPTLLKCLDDADATVRAQAVLALGARGDHPDTTGPRLLECLDKPERFEQSVVIFALSGFPSKAPIIIPRLAPFLSSTGTVRFAAYALERLGPEAALPLTLALTNENPEVRLEAADGLLRLQGRPTLRLPADLKVMHGSLSIRARVTRMLPRADGGEWVMVHALCGNLRHTDLFLRRFSAQALVNLYDVLQVKLDESALLGLIDALRDDDFDVAFDAWFVLDRVLADANLVPGDTDRRAESLRGRRQTPGTPP